jgi:hypothetical protein
MNPKVNTRRKNVPVRYPSIPVTFKLTAHGNKKMISISKIRKRIAIIEKRKSYLFLESSKGSNPHS